jgi:uncharacterized repeat protein (TIGR02543 family)
MKRKLFAVLAMLLAAMLMAAACERGSKPAVPQYTVLFNSRGGSAVAAASVDEGARPVRPTDPVLDGYIFDGWYKDAELERPWDWQADIVTSNLILYAGWREDSEIDPPDDPDEPVGADVLAGKLLIFQAYGTGDKSDGAVSHTFIELYNTTEQAVALDGYALQYASGSGEEWQVISLAGKTMGAHSSFLILGKGENTSPYLTLQNADADLYVAAFTLSNRNFKLCLIKSTAALTWVNPFNIDLAGTKATGYVDLLGACNDSGDSIDAAETSVAFAMSKQKAARRKSLTDTDANAVDFGAIDYRDYNKWSAEEQSLYPPKNAAYGAWDPFAVVSAGELSLALSQGGGMYTSEFNLTIAVNNTTQEACDVYYTKDSTDPLTSSTRIKYVNQIRIYDTSADANVYSAYDSKLLSSFYTHSFKPAAKVDKCFALRAVAITKSGKASQEAGASYFIGAAANTFSAAGIAVASIVTTPDNLFNNTTGIYVNGVFFQQNGGKLGDGWSDANYRQKGRAWERPARLDFFETGGQFVFAQNIGIRIQGGYSRGDIQKSLRMYAREEYQAGANRFEYPFFDGLTDVYGAPLATFKTLVLRTGSNDAFYCKFADTLHQSLVAGRAFDTQTGRACAVFLDGEYWGLYTLQEDYSDNYFADTYGVDKDEVVMIKADSEYNPELEEGVEGDEKLYDDMVAWFKTANLSVAAQYDEACRYMDVESFAEYTAFELYIRNEDWPGKNWALWRTRGTDAKNSYADGQWRWCAYDTEMGSYHYGNASTTYNHATVTWMLTQAEENVALFFRRFMQSPTFRAKLSSILTRYANTEMKWTLVDGVITRYTAEYGKTEMERFFKRFPISGASYSNATARITRMRTFFQGRETYVKNTMVNSF